jgi:hypothetical protein
MKIYHFSLIFFLRVVNTYHYNFFKDLFLLKTVKTVFYLIAIIEISTFTFLGSFATCTVSLAGAVIWYAELKFVAFLLCYVSNVDAIIFDF